MHRIRKHTRLRNFNYASEGGYFITMVTKNRVRYFGKIINKEMHFTETGQLAHEMIKKIPDHFSNVKLDEFCIMPDHVHCILLLYDPLAGNEGLEDKESEVNDDPDFSNEKSILPKMHRPHFDASQANRFSEHKEGSVSLIIQQLKAGVSRECRKRGIAFGWQGRFHDHVIRSESEFHRIKNYIRENAANWKGG